MSIDNRELYKTMLRLDAHLCGYSLRGEGPQQVGDGIIILDEIRKWQRQLRNILGREQTQAAFDEMRA
jgi:hypothetical protein